MVNNYNVIKYNFFFQKENNWRKSNLDTMLGKNGSPSICDINNTYGEICFKENINFFYLLEQEAHKP